ncbi:MAG: transposase [Bacteroidales bacterium]|nr:transposase [Bacteroidales bacterium]
MRKREITMNKYNPNIHHRKSIRLKGYDYSQAGLYFITICVQDRKSLFGKIAGGDNVGVEDFQPLHHHQPEMILNDAGKIADECWLEIPKHFPNAVLHEHIVMPNHVHGIVELKQNDDTNVGVENFHPPQQSYESSRNEFQKMIPRSIGSIVKGFKIGVTKWFRNNTDIENVWQRNYYEHIIRDEKSYQRISEYIINNPKNWREDIFFND